MSGLTTNPEAELRVTVIDRPEPFVSWAEAKAHLREHTDEQQTLIESYIAAATAWLDGPGGWLGRSLGVQTLELTDHAFACGRLPYGPVVDIESVTYIDSSGAEQTMPDTDYRLLADGTIYAETWPSVQYGPDSVRVRYVAGYPDLVVPPEDPEDEPTITSTIPAPIRQAILLLIGHWFVNREAVVTGTIATQLPMAAEALLSSFRVWR